MNDFYITFLIPGFLSPENRAQLGGDNGPSLALAAMQWTTGLSQRPWQAALMSALEGSDVSGLQLPMARLLQPHNSGDTGLVCADPVHLQADRDSARLLPSTVLNLSDVEASSLIGDLNSFLAADGLQINRDTAGRWFLSGRDASDLLSFPPSFLANRNASAYLPEGENSSDWKRLMAELQMLLHAHPINVAREQRRALPVNSLWFWGGGALPEKPTTDPSSDGGKWSIYADEEFCSLVSDICGIECRSLDSFDPETADNALVIDQRIVQAVLDRDEAALLEGIRCIESDWLEPLSSRIQQVQSGTFELKNEDGECGCLSYALVEQHKLADQQARSAASLFGQCKRVVLRFLGRG